MMKGSPSVNDLMRHVKEKKRKKRGSVSAITLTALSVWLRKNPDLEMIKVRYGIKTQANTHWAGRSVCTYTCLVKILYIQPADIRQRFLGVFCIKMADLLAGRNVL